MFIRKVTHTHNKNGKNYSTYKLVESIRTDRGPRQRPVLNLGTDFKLPKEQWKEQNKHDRDKRRVIISPLEKCALILEQAPSPLQNTFKKRFTGLDDWEQLMILSAMERVVGLMSAEKIDAAPILTTEPTASE